MLTGGTIVAVYRTAMRLSEAITIYLAAGAPFGVSCYLRQQKNNPHLSRFIRAAANGLLWPISVMRILLDGFGKSSFGSSKTPSRTTYDTKSQNTKRNLLASLNELSEVAARTRNSKYEDLERAVCVLRESVETVVGLSNIDEDSVVGASSNANVTELFRIAGYDGEELAVASLCANRRNVARINSHRTRARAQMVHAIADIGEAIGYSLPAPTDNTRLSLRSPFAEVFKSAIALLVLIGDEESAKRIALLFDYEPSRHGKVEHTEAPKVMSLENGEESCSTQTSQLRHALSSNEATMARG